MKIVTLKQDVWAQGVVSKLDPAAHLDVHASSNTIRVYVSTLGGDKKIGIYTLPNEKMPYAKGTQTKTGKRLKVSIYEEQKIGFLAKLTEIATSFGSVSAKRQNRLQRYQNRPKDLGVCDVYVALSFEYLTELDARSIKQQLISMTQFKLDSSLEGYGGAVVFNKLWSTGRVVLSRQDLPKGLAANSVYRKVTGFNEPVVIYGTTDVANLFELLQTLKLGHYLGLPIAFDMHKTAHNWGYWLNGFLNPGLALFGGKITPEQFGLSIGSKYTDRIGAFEFAKVLANFGMPNAANLVKETVGVTTISQLYNRITKTVVDMMLASIGIKVRYRVVGFEELCSSTEFWNMSANELARVTRNSAGHDVVILNKPNGEQLRSDSRILPNATVSQLYTQGWWLGGYPVYKAGFSLGRYGGMVTMIKDSSAGLVNLAARDYLSGASGLYVSPVGLFRLTSSGQHEDWSIDPIVMYELMCRWDVGKTRTELNKVWDAMEVPLKPQNIGKKTVATVSLKGVSIKK